MKSIITGIFFLTLTTSLLAQEPLVDIGLFADNERSTLDVHIRPDGVYDQIWGACTFTIRWHESDRVILGELIQSLPYSLLMKISKQGDPIYQAPYYYQVFAGFSSALLSDAGIQWQPGQEIPLVSIPVSFAQGANSVDLKATSFTLVQYGPPDANGDHYEELGVRDATGIVYSANTILPITLRSFVANRYHKNDVLLEWESEIEINASHYEIQRSTDSRSWLTIDKVEAVADEEGSESYRYIDQNAFLETLQRELVYYRLRMIDLDGSFAFSDVRGVKFDAEEQGFEVWPNPTHDKINITIDNLDVESIQLYDTAGRVLRSFNLQKAADTYKMEVSLQAEGITAGEYFLKLVTNAGLTITKKITIF